MAVAADMFKSACTAHINSLKTTLRNWNGSRCAQILQRIRRGGSSKVFSAVSIHALLAKSLRGGHSSTPDA